MKIFWAITKTIFKRTFQYRMGQALSMVIHPIVMIMWIAVFTALFRFTKATTLQGYDLTQMIWYAAGSFIMWTIIYNETAWTIANKIISGDLVQDLLKPVTVFKYELASSLGMRLMAFCLETLPDMIILPLFYPPVFMNLGSILRFIPVAAGAFLVFFHINFLIGLLSFVMKSTSSIIPIRVILIWTLGGGRLPLEFFPQAIITANAFLPFQYVFYYPLRVFLNMPGTQTPLEYLRILGAQAAWLVGLYILCRVLWNAAYRKFCAVG